MLLIFLVVFITQVFSEFRFSVIAELAHVSEIAHKFCVSSVPIDSRFQSEIAALVCAQNFFSEQEKNLYVASGLIHLFVVSGSHFLLLESMLYNISGRNYKFKKAILILLLIYAFMCKLSPPVCRSFISLSINQFLYSMNIRWTAHYLILSAGLICLLLNPDWACSVSLQLSWIAGLCIGSTAAFNNPRQILFRQWQIFLLMFPTISFFQTPSFSGILSNIFLAPLLEIFLFPAALIVCIFNSLYPLFDEIMQAFRQILISFEFKTIPNLNSIPDALIYWNWVLILFLHLFLHLKKITEVKANLRNETKN